MIDLKIVKNITISEGSVTKITDSSGVVLWEVKSTSEQTPCYYVAANVSDLPQSLYQAEYAQIGIQKFLITDYHWNVNSKAIVEFEINSDTNEFGKYGRILGIEGETTYSSYQSTWDIENTTWQTKPFGSTSWNRSTVVPNLNQKYVGEYAETGLTIDGTVITATTPSTSITANTSHYVCIGGYNTTDQTEYLDGKIYSVKIYESGTLVRDIVPLTNGLFYDKLSKKVYAAGAGGVCDTGGTSTLLVKNEPKYDMAYITSEKSWYKLNNKSQWEKYGVIELVSSLDNVTTYDGKLVCNTTDKHEYKYANNAWTDQGEVKVTQNVPDGYTTYDYIEQPTVRYGGTGATISAFTGVNGCTYNLKYYMPSANYSLNYYGWIIGDAIESNSPIAVYKLDNGWGTNSRTIAYYHSKWKVSNSVHSGNGDIPTDQIFNMEFTPSSLIAYDTDGNVITTFKTSTNADAFNSSFPLIMWGKDDSDYVVSGKLYELSMKDANGNVVNDCVPATETSSGNKGLLDLVTKTFYKVNDNSAVNMGTEKEYYSYTYPVSYDEYDAPNLDYTECANEAAMKALSCPYEGMKVKLTDTGKKYKFTYNSTTSQYEWGEITSSLDVDLNNQWIVSTKTLEGYKVYMSNSNHNVNSGYASMKFKFEGMPDFKIWINSYAESSYDYTVAWNLDVDYPASEPSSSTSGVKANTSNKQYDPSNGLTAFTEVDYANDGGEHFVVVTYRKDGSVNNNDDRGYVAVKLTLLSTTWVVSSSEFVKKDNKYYQRLNEVGTYEGGFTANTGNYKEGNELPVTYKQGTADDYILVGSSMYYKKYAYVTPVNTEINTGDYIQGDYIGEATPSMKVTYTDNTEKTFYDLTSIEQNTDSNKANAKSVEVYDGVTSIGNYAFDSCTGLTRVTISDSVTRIGDYAFHDCSKLTDITIPSGVTSIGNGVFYYCSNLTSITIPDSVTRIGDFVFNGCSNLTDITIPSGVTSIGNGVFYYCSNLTDITIPESVTSIGNYAFYNCSSLTSITIPNSVTSIGQSTFRDCNSLATVTIQNSTSKLAYNTDAFANIPSTAKLYVPSNLLSNYQSDTNWTNAFGGGIFAIGS